MSKSSIVLAFALMAACSGADARLEPLARVALDAGGGLGTLRLGKTTLGEFVERFGSGRADMVVSDQTGFELVFEGGQLSFLFLFEQFPRDEKEVKAMRAGTRDLAGYLAAYPLRRALPLASISVGAGKTREESFFQGRLDSGAALFDPLDEAGARIGIPNDGLTPMIAGMSPKLPDNPYVYAEQGVVLYGERAKDGEGPVLLTRMTIFPVAARD